MQGEPTGLAALDLITDGLSHHGLTLILGAPGTGKTTLAMQIAAAAMEDERDVVYLSMFSESHEKLFIHLRSFSFFDETRVGASMEMLSLKSVLGTEQDDLARVVFTALRGKRRPLLLLDGYRGLHAMVGGQVAHRFLATLASQLPYLDARCLVTAEYTGLDAREYAELTVADEIILLSRLAHGTGRYRMLEVLKLRGHAFREGPHGMAITADGIALYPRLATMLPEEEPTGSSRRCRFGLAELDRMLGGGLPAYSTTLVSGESGTGKTTLALQYLVAGADAGDPGLLVTFHERTADLIRKATDLGLDLVSALERGTVRILRFPPVELHPDAVAWRIVEEVRQRQIARVAIDGVRDLERMAGVLGAESDYLAALLEILQDRGATTVLLHDTSGIPAAGAVSLPITPNRVLLRRVSIGRSGTGCSRSSRCRPAITRRVFGSSRSAPAASVSSIPPRPSQASWRALRPSNRSMTSRLDVLVVDDDPDIRTLLVLLLEEHRLAVRTARNGKEAYQLAIELHPRLVLSDLMMPAMRGDALYAALQGNTATADITFVLMTSIPTKVPSGIPRVVGKPIELAALEALLLEALRERP